MAAPGLVTLAIEVPHVGVGGFPEGLVLAVSRKEPPLCVHSAAGEDVGQQVAGHGLLLQRVPGSVDILYPFLLRQEGKVSQVAEASSIIPTTLTFCSWGMSASVY